MKYHEIGERFEYDGVMLEVSPSDNCRGCFFWGKYICTLPFPSCCSEYTRRDKKDIYYKLVEQCKPKDMEQENNESKKNDRLDDKLRWELLPLEDIEDVVKVYTAGAKKYGPDKWQELPDGIRRYKAALLRHLVEYDKGNKIDEETGCHHLAAVAWNAIAMLHIDKQKTETHENTICSKEENLLTERKDTPEK